MLTILFASLLQGAPSVVNITYAMDVLEDFVILHIALLFVRYSTTPFKFILIQELNQQTFYRELVTVCI